MEIQITKVSVRKAQEGMFAITLNLRLSEAGIAKFSQDFTENYKTAYPVDQISLKFQMKMQTAIDNYKAEQQLYNHSQFGAAIATIKSQLIY